MTSFLYTSLAMIAFAANSILCRLALDENLIDAAAFTSIRLVSGILILTILVLTKTGGSERKSRGTWISGFMLFLYALTFSYAYITLDTGTGALILFGSVQITMILNSIVKGHTLVFLEWFGVVLAFCGFLYLILPGVSAPSPVGLLLMTISGISWGLYSLAGRNSSDPLLDTSYNFLRTLPFIAVLVIYLIHSETVLMTEKGIMLAMLSGGITSGIGYAIWYRALNNLSRTQAAVVQLSVPVIAATGGILFMAEILTMRLSLSAFFILSGILAVIYGSSRKIKEG